MKKCLLSVRHREQWWVSWPRHGESAAWRRLFNKKLPSCSLPRWLCEDWLRWMSSEATRHYSKVRSLSLACRKFFRCLLPPHCNCFSRDEQWRGPKTPALPSKFFFPNAASAFFLKCRSRRQCLLGPASVFHCLSGSLFSKDLWNSFQAPLVSFSVLWPKLWRFPWPSFLYLQLQAFNQSLWLSLGLCHVPTAPHIFPICQGDPHLSEVWVFLPPQTSLHPWTPSLFSPLTTHFFLLFLGDPSPILFASLLHWQ